jgi:dynein heavy chain
LRDPTNPVKALRAWYERQLDQINGLLKLVRGDLTPIDRRKIVALVTTDVHGRDGIDALSQKEVTSADNFNWQQQLRFYYNRDEGDYGECVVRQTNTCFHYGAEYQGNNGRLVITPLTDRCYLTLTTALHLHLGGSPASVQVFIIIINQ